MAAEALARQEGILRVPALDPATRLHPLQRRVEILRTIESRRAALTDDHSLDQVVRALRARLPHGLRELRAGRPWFLPKADLALVAPARVTSSSAKRRLQRVYLVAGTTDLLLLYAAELIVNHWDLVRVCPQCDHDFGRIRRQEYCSSRCSQRARWERYVEQHGPKRRDYHAEHERRQRKKLGNVKVGRRRPE